MSAPDRFQVVGAAVVLPLTAGGERYLYGSDAELDAQGYTEKGLRHAAAVGLVRLVEPDAEKPTPPRPDGRAGLEALLEYATAAGITVPAGADKAAVKALIDAQPSD